jgi:3-phenylpropionate/trans-cinnamate dioxygenase ferredoxin subunit
VSGVSTSAAAGRKYVVANVQDVPEGERLLVHVAGREIGIFHVDGEFYGLLNRCPHQGGPMCRGELVPLIEADRPGHFRFDPGTKLVACPWHGWEFDLRTGQSYWDPKLTRLRPFPVEVEDGKVIAAVLAQEGDGPDEQRLKGPYVAEVIPVSVEGQYLVVTMSRVPVGQSASATGEQSGGGRP